jgi:hypothetical protein
MRVARKMRMENQSLNVVQPTKPRYASILRCLGQALEAMDLKAVEIKRHGEDFIVQAWNRGTSMAMDVEKHYQLDDIRRMDIAARAQRRPYVGPPDLLSLSQVLRLTGNYVDRLSGRLLRVSWQDQSDKIQSITVQWEPIGDEHDGKKRQGRDRRGAVHSYLQTAQEDKSVIGERRASTVCECWPAALTVTSAEFGLNVPLIWPVNFWHRHAGKSGIQVFANLIAPGFPRGRE